MHARCFGERCQHKGRGHSLPRVCTALSVHHHCVHHPRCQRAYLVFRSRRWTGELLFSLQLIGTRSAYISTVLQGPQIVKHLGGGQPRSFPSHARPQNPQTHEIKDFLSNLGLSKVFWDPCLGHDTIWRPGQEMKVYVDNNKHVEK